MANHRSGAKGRKRKAGEGNVQSVVVQARPVGAKAALSKTMPEKVVVAKPHSVRGKVVTARLVNAMDLDEMLEASKVIEMGMKGEKIPTVKSSKAQRYARTILRLNRRSDTKPIAEKMVHDLNEFVEKIIVHERDRKGSADTTQKIEIYFNFIGEYIPPTMAEKEPTPEELEEMRKKEARKDKLHQNYLKRKANGNQKEYEERIKATNDCGATYGAVAYELGLQDDIKLMSELKEIK